MESKLQATLRPLFDLDPARANAPSEIVVPPTKNSFPGHCPPCFDVREDCTGHRTANHQQQASASEWLAARGLRRRPGGCG